MMEFRTLGRSGLKVPVLSFGTGTFGGGNEFFRAWGATDVAEATRLVDICMEAGINLFDTADIYSDGLSATVLGTAVAGGGGGWLAGERAEINQFLSSAGFCPPHADRRSPQHAEQSGRQREGALH